MAIGAYATALLTKNGGWPYQYGQPPFLVKSAVA
jgi:hypothetical protein